MAIPANGGAECQINCPQEMWYDINWICKPFHDNCADVENISGDCTACDSPYLLDGTTKRCLPPPCPSLHWRFRGLVCKANSAYCINAEDYTGKCLACLSPDYEVNPLTFICRIKGCTATEWRDNSNDCQPNPTNC